MKKSAVKLFFLASLFFIFSCSKDPVTTYKVSFNSNGGNAINSQTIEKNKTAAQPNNPYRVGSAFNGWYSDIILTKSFDFKTAITGNTILYAKWTIVNSVTTYTVTFVSNGGSTISSQQIASGKTATYPTDPTRTGYFLTGWYTTSDLSDENEFDFNTPITANTTLYAGWEVY